MRLQFIALYFACFAGQKAVEATPFVRHQSPWLLTTRGGADSIADAEVEQTKNITVEVGDADTSAEVDVDTSSDANANADVNVNVGPATPTVYDIDKLVFEGVQIGDGSDTDPDGIPHRFLRMQKGNREKAKASFLETMQWREENQINTILKRPNPKFDLCKKIFPVYIPGKDLQDNIVVVQRVGLIDAEHGKAHGVDGDDLLWFYIFIVEYCWNILDPAPDACMTTIMDLKGVTLKTFRDTEYRIFIRKFVGAMSDNYPNRSHKTLVINSPAWINAAYKFVKPLLRQSTRDKISIWNGGKKQDQLLIDILGKDQVPRELLNYPDDIGSEDGKSGHELSDIEKDMRHLCMVSLEKHSMEMQSVA